MSITPRPWGLYKLAEDDSPIAVVEGLPEQPSQRGVIAMVAGTAVSPKFSDETIKANAAHIVKCVNLHEDLVGALKRFIDLIDEGAEPMELNYASIESARLIAKAEAE